jgi:hypothetical protein
MNPVFSTHGPTRSRCPLFRADGINTNKQQKQCITEMIQRLHVEFGLAESATEHPLGANRGLPAASKEKH